jgi:hypothetical protein
VGHPLGSGCFYLYRLDTEWLRRADCIPPAHRFGAVVGCCNRHTYRTVHYCTNYCIECWGGRHAPRCTRHYTAAVAVGDLRKESRRTDSEVVIVFDTPSEPRDWGVRTKDERWEERGMKLRVVKVVAPGNCAPI